MSRYQKFAEQLSDKGWDTTPLRGKIPILTGWQNRPETALKFDQFPDANIGIVCGGKHNVIAVDIDVLSDTVARVIRALAEDMLGTAPERIGAAPKTLFVYRCTDPISKIKTSIYDITGGDACIEILAEGQQFVASGIHPNTGKSYQWPGDSLLDYTPEALTAVTPEDVEQFVAACNLALADRGPMKSKSQTNNNIVRMDTGKPNFDFQENDPTTSTAKLQAAMDFISNDDLHYDDWVRLAHAFKAAVGAGGIDLFHEFSAKSSKYEAAETDRLWNSIETVTKIGAGSLFHLAAEQGFDIANWDAKRNFGPEDIAESPTSGGGTIPLVEHDGSFTAASVKGPIAARQWVLEGWFPARTVAMLFGAGGVGKTLLMQQLANCVAQGASFMGIDTMEMPVLSVMCEDDAEEVKRRQLNINEWLGVDEFGEGPEDLHLWPRVGDDNVLVTWPSGGKDEPGAFYEQLCNKVAAVKGDADSVLVILDTAADTFGGNENERRTVNTFLKTYLGSIVINYNATVILLAHPSLSGLSSGSGLSGSTAWENSVRARAYLSREADSDDIRILSRKKSNYSDISGNSDIKLIWENGVLAIPSSPDALDRINATAMKHDIMAEIDIAWGEKNGIRKQGPRGYKTALPSLLKQHKIGAVIKAFNDLVAEGNIIHVERFGYKTEKSI
jgi:hypothetical protein